MSKKAMTGTCLFHLLGYILIRAEGEGRVSMLSSGCTGKMSSSTTTSSSLSEDSEESVIAALKAMIEFGPSSSSRENKDSKSSSPISLIVKPHQ